MALPNKCNSTSDQIVKWKEMLSILGFRASTIIPVHSSRAATRSRAISSVKWRSVHLPGVETSSSLGCPFFFFFLPRRRLAFNSRAMLPLDQCLSPFWGPTDTSFSVTGNTTK